MAQNALQLNTTGKYVEVTAASAINDLSSFTMLALVRTTNPAPSTFNVLARKASSDLGTNTAGWRWIYDGTQAARAARVRVGFSTSELSYSTGSNTPRPITPTEGVWGWTALAVDYAAGTGDKVRVYSCDFGSAFAETAKSGATEPVGTLASDSAINIRIGAGAEPPDIAFFGIKSGQLTAAQLDSWVADMDGEAASSLLAVRLGFGGASSAPDVSPNGLTTTITGSPTLITDAPDYWTGDTGGGGTPAFGRYGVRAPVR